MKTRMALITLMLMGLLTAHDSVGKSQHAEQKKEFNLTYYDIREDIMEKTPSGEIIVEFEINEQGTDGLYDLVDREGSVPWKEFDPQERNFYEQSYYVVEKK